MTLGDLLGLSDTRERQLARGLQLVLAGLLGYGLLTFQLGMAANGALALGLTFLPAALRREYGYAMDAGLVLWVTVAVFLHSVGSLGPYDWFGWYDEVAHTVTATVIAGIGYAAFRAFELHSTDVDAPPAFRAVFVVVFVLAAGIVWELLEFASGQFAAVTGTKAALAVMGIDDIVTDMIFNTVGAVVVAAWGTHYVGGLVGFFGRRLRSGDDG